MPILETKALSKIFSVSISKSKSDLIREFEPINENSFSISCVDSFNNDLENNFSSESLLKVLVVSDRSALKGHENWILETEKLVKVSSKSLDIKIAGDRAIVLQEENLNSDSVRLLASYAFYESTLKKIESILEENWKTVQKDIRFIHRVSKTEVDQWAHVQKMTELSASLRITLERLSPEIENFANKCPLALKRIAEELIDLANFEDRIEWASDKLEVLEDTYESANDRLSEFHYFSTEAKLEIWIIVILVVELLLNGAEFFFGH